jgi:hypothetical protein
VSGARTYATWDWNYEPSEARSFEALDFREAARHFAEYQDSQGDYQKSRDVYVRDVKTNIIKVVAVTSEQSLDYYATEKC